jgi:3-dehydrosphinganine reductase
MIERGEGCIVNVASLVALFAGFGYSAYGASKWAIRGLTDTLRYELKSHGIQVNLACPPDTDTPQLAFEEPIKPFETKILAASSKVYSPETVARDILRGVERNRYIILTGFESKLFYWAAGLTGSLQYRVLDMLTADAVKKKEKAEAKNRIRL